MTTILGRITPQPPRGIKYMIGAQSWLKPEDRSVRCLFCEEWGNLGPMELDSEIKPNKVGLRVRHSVRIAPAGTRGFTEIDGVYFWTDTDVWEQMAERAQEPTDEQ